METAWLANALMHPIAIAVLILVVLTSTFILTAEAQVVPISRKRLIFGYLGVLITSLLLVAAISYVSPQEALDTWQVPAERYWSALLNQFFSLFVLFTYIAFIGVALVGAPAIFWLARRGLGTIPWVLLFSASISLVSAAVLVQSSSSPIRSFLTDAPLLVGWHLALAIGFCVAARMPWRKEKSL